MLLRRPYTQLYCHLVWATWDRLPFITEEVEPRLFSAMRAKIVEMGCGAIAIGGIPDHVHCLVRFTPTFPPRPGGVTPTIPHPSLHAEFQQPNWSPGTCLASLRRGSPRALRQSWGGVK